MLSQGVCNSCAAHNAITAIESCLAIASSKDNPSSSFIVLSVFFVDTVAYPLSTQQIIDCTNGISDGNGTVMFRQNSNCKAGYADLHLKWLLETQEPLQSAQQYPLLPEGSDPNPGQCRRAYRPVYGYGADYYIHINKRQVRNGHSLSYVI